MRILGADLPRTVAAGTAGTHTLVLLGDDGATAEVLYASTLPELAAHVGRLAAGDPFLLGVNVPVVVPGKPARVRPVESLVRRRLGYRMPPGGRSALGSETLGIAGETLMAGLAAAGQPCLPYPDRDRRRPGLAETYPGLILKALLWEQSPLAERERSDLPELFRAYTSPAYRSSAFSVRTGWAERAAGVDQVLRLLEPVAGFDFTAAREALAEAASAEEVERAASILDATLIAGMARRYDDAPQSCLYVGDPEGGYVILPANELIRQIGSDTRPTHGRLFPQGSLRERLGPGVKVRAVDLLNLPGRAQRLEASFNDPPRYEFDNVDEMLWWKHTRHLTGTALPTEGLCDLVVRIGDESDGGQLRLTRSRHRTLSFRFEPPSAWRSRLPTRDGKTYGFDVLRAVYETLPRG